ncbi:hypothetical protein [Bradyrhizobium monzae]|uniref:hypothetical protein n=1 Tax=Bradyrhizobium sp. Oc8 TaxID=2876780 RepID=UPI001F194CAB|nr:hypothetical protein [Bradyrhizobium sp. Oc8]
MVSRIRSRAKPTAPVRNTREYYLAEFRESHIYDDRLLLSRKLVMRLLDISYDTIERLEAAGKLPRVQFSTGGSRPGRTTKVLYRRDDVLRLIEASTIARPET